MSEPVQTSAMHLLKAHLDALGIRCETTAAGNVSIRDPRALLDHLTDEKFIARAISPAGNVRAVPPVPNHRTENPVGALHEWCAQTGKALEIVPRSGDLLAEFRAHGCDVKCDGFSIFGEASTKNQAKRLACQSMLDALAKRYGAARVAP